jgi:hypothetical protein|tara:strand:+ start:6859 stop:7560 length:702 start_codon:yes stop_codon:yes gene_type:complete
MKIAVCVSGQQRKTTIDFEQLNIRMKTAFINFDTDYFYHTWDNCVLKEYENIVIESEPIINYSPVKDTTIYAGEYFDLKRKSKAINKLNRGTKQILAHNSLVAKLNKTYDVIVRVRWDLYFSNTLNYSPFLNKAKHEGPVGLGFPRWDLKMLEEPEEYLKTKNNKRWWKMISPDNLIMHTPETWNVNLVNNLHEKKELLPAEWGWYQILCSDGKDMHTGYRGGAISLTASTSH